MLVSIRRQDDQCADLDGLRGDQRVRHVAPAGATEQRSGPSTGSRAGRNGADRFQHAVDRCVSGTTAERLGQYDNGDADGDTTGECLTDVPAHASVAARPTDDRSGVENQSV